jgi:glycosyltransferase involved in cell wall biosynthesis
LAPVKVLVDARSLTSGRGVARYTRRMLEAGAAASGPGAGGTRWHVVLPADGPADATLPSGLHVHRARLPSRILFGLAAATGRPRLDALGGGADVVWLPAVAPVAVSPRTPVVLTVHDLSFLTRPQEFTRYERAWHHVARVDRLVARAAAIVCDTHTVAAEVADRWPAAAGRVHVVVPGVDAPPAGPAAAPPAGVPARYLLWVGALEPRKAPEILAAAFAAARRDGLDAALVVAGTGREAGTLSGPGIHHAGAVDDATLHALYAGALALVMPSRLEGFGLPPLEAALHGTPSVLSDLPVFAETLGDAALRVPVGDVPALASALLQLGSDDTLRARLGAAAKAAATPLGWPRAARELDLILRGVAR